MNDRFKDFDDEERQLVLDFEKTVLNGTPQFFDVDELEVIIDYYFEVGDMPSLERAVEYAEQLYPDSTEVKLRRAHLYIAHEQFEPALRIIRRLRAEHPDDLDVAYSLGVAYGAVGESRKAIELFMEAASDGWLLGRVYANIGEEYYRLHDDDNAIRYYELALDTDSYDQYALSNYTDICIGAGRADQAVRYLKTFVGEHPYSREAWCSLGVAYRALRQYEQSFDAFEYAIAIDKSYVEAYTELADSYEEAGQVSEAATTLLRARDYADDRSDIYRSIAYLYLRADNLPSAIDYFRRAIEENPDDARSHAALAMAFAHDGDASGAMPLIRKALHLEPDNAEVLCAAAILFDGIGNTEAAADYFDRMVSAQGCTEPQCQCYTQFLFQHELYDLLIDFALESLEIYPQHPFYCTYLAAVYFLTNRYNRASSMLPFVDAALLRSICPQLLQHPRLGPLVPERTLDDLQP